MNNIYSGYRGQRYTEVRSKWEKWYTRNYNFSHESEGFINERLGIIHNFIKRKGFNDIHSVLDVGGDQGQFIPQFNSRQKNFVLEKSNRELKEGVVRIDSFSDIENVDLVIYAHILEHVTDPLIELEKLAEISKYIYIEVPSGVPKNTWLRKNLIFQLLVASFTLSPKVWSYFSNPAAGRSSSSKILRQSEHLNFFTTNTLKKLADRLNLNSYIIESLIPTPDNQVAKVYQVLMWRQLV